MTTTELRSDCSRCFALCCVLLPYAADAGFGADKVGGTPCLNLADDDRCTIHQDLRGTGWVGCTIFECFGAGQHVSQVTYAGTSWRDPQVNRGEMAAVFSALRVIHEMLFHLEEALSLQPSNVALQEAWEQLEEIRGGDPDDVLGADLDELVDEIGGLLKQVSREVRGGEGASRRDLIGRDLRSEALAGADLRGALLIATDLRGVDLTRTDLLGADLRDAKVQGADLSQALFLTQPQVNAALGDATTRIPARLRHPWSN